MRWSFFGSTAAAAVAVSDSRSRSGCREGFVVLRRTNACLTERRLRRLQQIGTSIDGERAAGELRAVEGKEEQRKMHEQHRPRWRERRTARSEGEHRRRRTCGLCRMKVACLEDSKPDLDERV